MLYEVWSEGYACTGERGLAIFHGEWEGLSFCQACNACFKDSSYHDQEKNNLWGCTLFDNEADARASFG